METELKYNARNVNAPDRSFDRGRADLERKLMPSFFIVGAQKAGTTSLMSSLVQHAEVVAPLEKEINYWHVDQNFELGLKYYASYFPEQSNSLLGRFRTNRKTKITGDATANTLECLVAAARVKAHFPEGKIVIMLRNPVDRAYSHYQMAVRYGFEEASFEEALALEQERIDQGNVEGQHNYAFQRLGYRSKGAYVQFLKPWLEHFSADQLLFLKMEDWAETPEPLWQQLLDFLALSPMDYSQLNLKHVQRNEATYAPMLAETRRALVAHYHPLNQELNELTGRAWGWNS